MPWHPERKQIIAPAISMYSSRTFSIMSPLGQVLVMVFGELSGDGEPHPDKAIVFEIENRERGLWLGHLMKPMLGRGNGGMWERSSMQALIATTRKKLDELIRPTIQDLWESLWVSNQEPQRHIDSLEKQLVNVNQHRTQLEEEMEAWRKLIMGEVNF